MTAGWPSTFLAHGLLWFWLSIVCRRFGCRLTSCQCRQLRVVLLAIEKDVINVKITCRDVASMARRKVWVVMSSESQISKLDVTGAIFEQTFIDIRLTTPRYHHVIHRRLHLSASRPLRPNVTSSIKPEVHNAAQRRWRRTEPQPQGICTQNFVPIGSVIQRYARGQTNRQTDRQIETG